jgi:lipoprotein signal peptidase
MIPIASYVLKVLNNGTFGCCNHHNNFAEPLKSTIIVSDFLLLFWPKKTYHEVYQFMYTIIITFSHAGGFLVLIRL